MFSWSSPSATGRVVLASLVPADDGRPHGPTASPVLVAEVAPVGGCFLGQVVGPDAVRAVCPLLLKASRIFQVTLRVQSNGPTHSREMLKEVRQLFEALHF